MQEIKPCELCDSTNAWHYIEKELIFVQCQHCFHTSKKYPYRYRQYDEQRLSHSKATIAWNTRKERGDDVQ